jgi:hypothetical protein
MSGDPKTVRRHPPAAGHNIRLAQLGRHSARTPFAPTSSGMGPFAISVKECHFVPRPPRGDVLVRSHRAGGGAAGVVSCVRDFRRNDWCHDGAGPSVAGIWESRLFRRDLVGEEQPLAVADSVARVAHPGLECGQAEGFEHVLPAAQAGVLGLDGGPDRLALGLGQPFPGGAERGLAGLVATVLVLGDGLEG